MKTDLSQKLFDKAQLHIPGGVNSPVRAYKSVGGVPPFIVRAKGAYVYDADGNAYIDYVGSWGPAILGHTDPNVLNELNQVMKSGLSFGAPTVKEIEMAELVKQAYPSIDLVRFVNSGTEATFSAIRLARGYTQRDKIIKFDGCYHGHADYLLVKAGSGAATCGIPDSLGVPASFTEHTLVAEYNNLDSVKKLFAQYPKQIACIIVEPVIGNMGCIPPQANFLKGLREICTQNDCVLIFDEVMTGFRLSFGGAQQLFDIKPDVTCLGKIVGGGLPVGAYGGKKDIMECVAPLGGVYQAGTLSGNPLAMTAGIVTLKKLQEKKVYDTLEKKGQQLQEGLQKAAKNKNIDLQINRVGSMFSFYFSSQPIHNANDARQADAQKFVKVFHHMLENGVYLAPSPFEAGFISLAHTFDDIDKTISVFSDAI